MRVPVFPTLAGVRSYGPFLNKRSSTRGSLFFCGVALHNTLNSICAWPLPYDLPHVQEFTWLHSQSAMQTYKHALRLVSVVDSLAVIPGS